MSSVVVADAGPLHYLILVDCAEILPKLFDRVLIPSAVRKELSHCYTPAKVADWMRVSKPWLTTEYVLDAALERDVERRKRQRGIER